jgi:hypothetical protein
MNPKDPKVADRREVTLSDPQHEAGNKLLNLA